MTCATYKSGVNTAVVTEINSELPKPGNAIFDTAAFWYQLGASSSKPGAAPGEAHSHEAVGTHRWMCT